MRRAAVAHIIFGMHFKKVKLICKIARSIAIVFWGKENVAIMSGLQSDTDAGRRYRVDMVRGRQKLRLGQVAIQLVQAA
jgi:hypothetical protein